MHKNFLIFQLSPNFLNRVKEPLKIFQIFSVRRECNILNMVSALLCARFDENRLNLVSISSSIFLGFLYWSPSVIKFPFNVKRTKRVEIQFHFGLFLITRAWFAKINNICTGSAKGELSG
jgi:hypothetical protein